MQNVLFLSAVLAADLAVLVLSETKTILGLLCFLGRVSLFSSFFFYNMKQYKAVSPQDTIHRIRTILHELGLFTTEQYMQEEGMYYSCRVCINNHGSGKFEIGTNGKGMTAEYALASAYAELMERLENRMIVFGIKYATKYFRQRNSQLEVKNIPELPFRFFPDESVREISPKEMWQYCLQMTPNVAKYKSLETLGIKNYMMYFADFYNAMDDRVDNLPYYLLRMTASSTGLCAGNVPEEAILQGIYEIFERYVLQMIYLHRLTPPTIPFEVFEGTEIAFRLKKLQVEKGWSIETKDCSLGKGFPVIGLLLIDRKKNRYAFRLGADLSPIIALQRCFTEIFQGADASERFFQPIKIDDNWDICKEHNQSVVNGSGRFPHQIFGTNYSWAFDDFELQEQASYKEDLQYIKHWLEVKGHTLYVRDNSFLGFPAYHLFIPGLSEIDAQLYDVIDELRKDNINFFKIKSEYRLQSLGREDKKTLIENLNKTELSHIRLFMYNSNAFNNFNRFLLLALLSYSIGKDDDAYNYMSKFLDEKAKSGAMQDVYYYCVRDVFYANCICKDNDEIVNMLSTLYTNQLVDEVLSDMADRENILKNFPLPVCFQCERCMIKKDCYYSVILELEQKIQTVYHKQKVNQKSLRRLFVPVNQ